MNDKIQQMRNAVLAGDHKARRAPFPVGEESSFRDPSLSYSLRTALRFEKLCDLETPIVEKDAQLALQRTVIAVPEVCSEEEMAALRALPDSECQLVLSIDAEDLATVYNPTHYKGKENNSESLTYRFYRYSEGRSYMTINGEGEFYVDASYVQKLSVLRYRIHIPWHFVYWDFYKFNAAVDIGVWSCQLVKAKQNIVAHV